MSELVTALYERNLFCQQLDFKWKSYLHLRCLLAHIYGRPHVGFFRKTLLTLSFLLVFLLDFTLGAGLVIILQENVHIRPLVTEGISFYTLTMLRWVSELITWLMGNPGGLKLNTPLTNFLGTRMLSIVNLWSYFYSDFIATYLSSILSCIFFLSPLGITVSIAVLHDFHKFLNLCSICFFIVMGRVLSLQVSALKSLARLFMGKKWNILRHRIDSYDYDKSQLLVGTIFFTILLFLLPTTSMYFVIFLHLRVLQFSVQLVLRIAMVVVNRITCFAWKKMMYFIEDQPITSLKFLVDFVGSKNAGHVSDSNDLIGECDCIRNCRQAKLRLKWNGREYGVEEVKALIAATPVGEIMNEIRRHQGRVNNGEKKTDNFEHPMLNLIGSLKIWPK